MDSDSVERASDPGQRWRIVFRRGHEAAELTHREIAQRFEQRLVEAGVPLWTGSRSRSRVVFAAPLPVGVAAERELVDVLLSERRPIHQVRPAVAAALPEGHELVTLYDVWIGLPSLAGQAAAADYRVTLGAGAPDGASLAEAARSLLSSREIVRERVKGSGTVRYDLRALVVDVTVVDAGPPVVLGMRTRFDPERGTGRPEEVVAALGEAVRAPLEVAAVVRERVILASDLTEGGRQGAPTR